MEDILNKIEAVLFSAGRAVGVREIAQSIRVSAENVQLAIKQLTENYAQRNGAIEIVKVGDRYAMHLKSGYANIAKKFADMEIPPRVLKTLALIAYHQPIKQSELHKLLGDRVYEHVPLLTKMGLIEYRMEKNTKLLSLTKRFPEYFGISETDKETIKKWLNQKLKGK